MNLLEAEDQLIGAFDGQPLEKKLPWAERWVAVDSKNFEEEPKPVNMYGRVITIQQLMVSFVSMIGGTKLVGKGPRGKLARKLHKKGKGQGQFEFEDDDD